MSDSVRPQRWQPTRLPHPWDSLGKNTGVGCHFFLQCMKVKSESEITSVESNSVRPHRRQPTRLPPPWDLPGKSTGVGVPLPSLLRSSTTNKFRHKTQTHDLHDRWYSPLGKGYKTSDKFCKIAWSKPCKNAVDTTHKHFPIICCSPCSSNSHISVLITGRRTYSI